MTQSSTRFRGPWIILACFFTFGIASGFPFYNISFFFDYLAKDHGWTQQAVTLGGPIAVLLTIWAGPLIVPRFSPRWLIVIGTGLTCLAFHGFARVETTVGYYASWCVWMFGYFLSGPPAHQVILSNWYKKKRGRAMGIAYVGGAALGIVGNKMVLWLVNTRGFSYTDTLQVCGYFMLLAWPFAFFILRDRPEDLGQTVDGESAQVASVATAAEVPGQTFAQLSGQPSFWLLLVGSAASIGAIASVNFLAKFVFLEQGFTDQAERNAIWAAFTSTALYAAIAARLSVGWLADHWPRKALMIFIYAEVAVALPMLFLIRPESPGWVYAAAIVFGFAQGADYMLIPLMAADLFGVRSLARAMSSIVPSDTVAQYWLPNLISRLAGVAVGGYSTALWVACGVAALGAAAIAGLKKSKVE